MHMSMASRILRHRTSSVAALGVATALFQAQPTMTSSSSSSALSSDDKTAIRVATYNVLSDSLCRANHYVHSAPEHLENGARLERVKAKLAEEMDRGAILSLQEVSRKWAADLAPFFEEKGYTIVAAPYGKKFNGYMGVAVAWPRSRYALERAAVDQVSDTVAWVRAADWTCPSCAATCFGSRDKCFKCGAAKPKEAVTAPATPATPASVLAEITDKGTAPTAAPVALSPPAAANVARSGVLAAVGAFLASLFGPTSGFAAASSGGQFVREERVWNTWSEVARRENCVVMVQLRPTGSSSSSSFAVATYHMPCLFGSDEKCQVMVAHAALLFQRAQRFAHGLPLVVMGDFNVQPATPVYELMTKGRLPLSHPQHPPMPPPITDAEWSCAVRPMRSAYADATGSEPAFTNFAWSAWDKDNGPFQETLDYVFLSDHWEVQGVRALPGAKADVAHLPGFPSQEEPSDHLLIAADLNLKHPKP